MNSSRWYVTSINGGLNSINPSRVLKMACILPPFNGGNTSNDTSVLPLAFLKWSVTFMHSFIRFMRFIGFMKFIRFMGFMLYRYLINHINPINLINS